MWLILAWSTGAAAADQADSASRSARQVYEASCAACHGLDGKGAAPSTVGFDTPLPDFTDCSFATREPDADWFAIAHDGGPVRAFHRRMPAFGEAISVEQIERSIEHIRGFCPEPAWPRGDLNLPRPLVTEKAFPEDEAVLTTIVGTGPAGSVTNEFLYERRFGARNQLEVAVPVALAESGGGWNRGLGDVAVALKRVLFHSLDSGSIVSATGELVLPTGKETQGLGTSGKDVQSTLSAIVSQFGSSTAVAKAFADQDGAIKTHLTGLRDSYSGVSIDEEMITMQQAQRAYEAIAKVIQTADGMLETLLNLR